MPATRACLDTADHGQAKDPVTRRRNVLYEKIGMGCIPATTIPSLPLLLPQAACRTKGR
ncbi:hypothetical protein E2C01_071978 [Portunus trituberculatus]|uniref:Uncharacterized protein n=1 Tax=Portunus trituberculatus TaxID=210409 RepID=A0A5B7HWS2_PORTR|nr:hypothetical protein [Portunus trituberculatus]